MTDRPVTTSAAATNTDDIVVGVDTHKDVHVMTSMTMTGRRLSTASFATTTVGIAEAMTWAGTSGTVKAWAVEGTGSYGAGLARTLTAAGQYVAEVSRPNRRVRRQRGGKTDAIDSEAAARTFLADFATAVPKAGDGPIELIRITRAARSSAVKARTAAINELKAVIVTAPSQLRDSLRGLSTAALINKCNSVRLTGSVIEVGTKRIMRTLAQRYRQLDTEAKALKGALTELIQAANPQLLDVHGVGPDTAAALLISAGDNPQRLISEAAFAALCGVNPIPASSGQHHRMRLNRAGNRQANAALHRIVIVRLGSDPETQQYMRTHVTPNGSNKLHVIRVLKRYLARRLYPLINPQSQSATAPKVAA